MTIRLAIIGFGKIARDQHGPAIAGTGAFELAAVVDPGGGAGAPVPALPTIAALLESGIGVDAVAICTPPAARCAAALAALDAGWDVLLEKPPAATVSEARAIVDRAAALGRTVFTAWHSREHAAVDEARVRLAGQAVTEVAIRWCEDVEKWHPGQEWIWKPGGFGVFDPAINALSILTALLPGPVWPSAARMDTPDGAAMPIRAEARLAGQGLIGDALFDWSPTDTEQWEIRLRTSAGDIQLLRGGASLLIDGKPITEQADEEYPRLYRRFAELIDRRESDVDLRPLELVADIFLLAGR